mmetsp:Transcript_55481/g.109993  ORF Transcript_55481/g.109993 Transcript_55481/m.109993 type:complete len:157 (-) Transcript_55481:83-553(-)
MKPRSQGKQSEPPVEYWPTPQGVHASSPGLLELPALHARHTTAAPALRYPAGQELQYVAPSKTWMTSPPLLSPSLLLAYFPTAHAEHAGTPAVDVVPALQGSQSEIKVLPASASEVPGGHLVQEHSVLQLGAPMTEEQAPYSPAVHELAQKEHLAP